MNYNVIETLDELFTQAGAESARTSAVLCPSGAAPSSAQRASALLATVDDENLRLALRDAFEERAGICEYDGGLSRDLAEAEALEDMLQQMRLAGVPVPRNVA